MPVLIDTIDAIARQKKRNVLCVTFHNPHSDDTHLWESSYDWEHDPMRETICRWLTEHHINWQMCGYAADEECMSPYHGQIYLDVPFDDDDPLYVLVRDHLENTDGTMRFDTVSFWYLPLATAMENAHHDVPGFWDKWAKNY